MHRQRMSAVAWIGAGRRRPGGAYMQGGLRRVGCPQANLLHRVPAGVALKPDHQLSKSESSTLRYAPWSGDSEELSSFPGGECDCLSPGARPCFADGVCRVSPERSGFALAISPKHEQRHCRQSAVSRVSPFLIGCQRRPIRAPQQGREAALPAQPLGSRGGDSGQPADTLACRARIPAER